MTRGAALPEHPGRVDAPGTPFQPMPSSVRLMGGIYPWESLGLFDGNVLLVVNSSPSDEALVADVLEMLKEHASGDKIHVVAPPQWGARLAEWGVSPDRLLLAADPAGGELELNYFLETPHALLWTVPKQFHVIIGTSAHNLYNEEVKDIFEQRVSLLLGDGRFLAHTLPAPYVYVFELADLLKRLGRERKRQDYLRRCRSFIEEHYQVWRAQGAPAETADPISADSLDPIGRHFGAGVLAFDEKAAAPLRQIDTTDSLSGMVAHLREVLLLHDEQLAERAGAVEIRDSIVGELREADDTLLRRLRRRLRRLWIRS